MLREAVIALVLLAPAFARAQPTPTPAVEEASRRYDNGVTLFGRQDYASAYAEFKKAYELTHRYEVLFNLGVTAQKLSRYREAIQLLDQYLHDGGDAIAADRRAAVAAAEAEIRALVAEVAVVVTGDPAELEVDGHHEGATPLAEPLLLTSGSHTLIATRGAATDRKTIEIESGNRVEVRLEPRAPVTTAQLTVRTAPDHATLTIDHLPLGDAPWSGTVDKGGHTIAATLAGRRTVSQEFTVEAGQTRELVLELPELPVARPWYKRWYVIAGLGAIVVAGGGTLIYLGTRENGIHYSP